MALKLEVIELTTASIENSLRFYALLDVPVPTPEMGEDHVEAVLPSGLKISWDTIELMKQINPDWVDPIGHRIGLAFQCESPSAVNGKYQEVLENGFAGKSEPWDAFWGQRYAQVIDPDGNIIDLFAPLS